jgi:cytochrome c biogenesis protein CcdA
MLFVVNGFLALFTYALGIVQLLLTVVTDFGAELFKGISFPLHGVIELIAGVVLIVLDFTLF